MGWGYLIKRVCLFLLGVPGRAGDLQRVDNSGWGGGVILKGCRIEGVCCFLLGVPGRAGDFAEGR